MDLKVFCLDGKQSEKTVILHPDIYEIEPNKHAIYIDVKAYLANRRQGTAKTKQRSEVSGSTRKLYRQKGTGYARRGDIKSPLLIGGGKIFGPIPRDYSLKVNKKVKILARKSALTFKARENAITIIEPINFDVPKTKKFVEILKNFNVIQKKLLFVFDELNKNVILSARNIPNLRMVRASQLNTYLILWAQRIFMTEGSLKEIEKVLLKEN